MRPSHFEQSVERFRKGSRSIVCYKTIYRWINEGRLVQGSVADLRHKGKQRHTELERSLHLINHHPRKCLG
ncbi:hypothetical protein [Paenibacillus sp. FSL P2-0173]|uniref:hypothetical protein n=1 Tax=Paenibacillus sp. FSL P2-0173 TaxID=2921627 RepID=UPI0030F855CD